MAVFHIWVFALLHTLEIHIYIPLFRIKSITFKGYVRHVLTYFFLLQIPHLFLKKKSKFLAGSTFKNYNEASYQYFWL